MKFADLLTSLTSISALGAAIMGLWNHSRIRELHILVNSRLTALLEVTKASSFAEGQKSQKDADAGPRDKE